MIRECREEWCTVETSDKIKLDTRIFKPREEEEEEEDHDVGRGSSRNENFVVILVHPYSLRGCSQVILGGIGRGLACRGYKAVTFNMRGVGTSTGKPSITGFKEINDVVAVCKWASENLHANRILLVGSSAGTLLFPSIYMVMYYFRVEIGILWNRCINCRICS